eukprot:12553-Chlamydomonas_euryale.AAC.1
MRACSKTPFAAARWPHGCNHLSHQSALRVFEAARPSGLAAPPSSLYAAQPSAGARPAGT